MCMAWDKYLNSLFFACGYPPVQESLVENTIFFLYKKEHFCPYTVPHCLDNCSFIKLWNWKVKIFPLCSSLQNCLSILGLLQFFIHIITSIIAKKSTYWNCDSYCAEYIQLGRNAILTPLNIPIHEHGMSL